MSIKFGSTRNNVIIAGSLDENFARTLLNNCTGLSKSYRAQIVGMPTWEGVKDFSKTEYRTLPIFYSTTFYNAATTGWSTVFEESYRKKTFSKPSDMAFKGFEITYYFVHLLLKYDTAILSNLNDKSLKLITDYDFKPIRWTKTSDVPDYFENKRIYILRRLNGQVSLLN